MATFVQALQFVAAAGGPRTAAEARRLAHSIQELLGLHGAVSDEYVIDLLRQADTLLATREPGDDAIEDLAETRPGTPTALRKRDTRSGTHPLARRDTTLRFRAGSK